MSVQGRQFPFLFNNSLASFSEIQNEFNTLYPEAKEWKGKEHILGCTFVDGVNFDHMCAAAVAAHKTFPTAMVFEGRWGTGVDSNERPLRILIDCGSTMEAIVNTSVKLSAKKLAKASLEPHRIRAGGGVIESNARVWNNQHIFVSNSSVSVNKVVQLDLPALDYDLILLGTRS